MPRAKFEAPVHVQSLQPARLIAPARASSWMFIPVIALGIGLVSFFTTELMH